ncbi:MAG: hypothetical protein PHQ75_15570 [Thermoguttaceae bacterium]|nr:hypothetical protein [Thermoguttaceae bacterium]
MKFFIAGIMQGSETEKKIHSQNYRTVIKEIVLREFPDADVYDPFEKHKNSLQYGTETGKETFLRHNKMCGNQVDCLIAFIPEASMGTAIEMWEAWKNGATVISISPMAANWAVKFLSHAVYPDIESFAESAGDFLRSRIGNAKET